MGEKEGFLPFFKGFETIAMHHSQDPGQWQSKAIIPHIIPSTVFKIDDPKSPREFTYSRVGNPTRTILQNVLSVLNKGRFSICFSSGMSALVALMGLLHTGQHIVCCNEVSGETYEVFGCIAKNYNIHTTFTNFNDLSNVCEAIQKNTKLVWAENPTDATLNIIDICSLSKITKDKNVLLGVNNTYLTPYLQRPLELGADIVMQSITKYMNGHSDIIMGNLTVDDDCLRHQLTLAQTAIGMVAAPFDCYEVLRGLKTLNLRMNHHLKNSATIAKYLGKHPAVEKVIHPGLADHPNCSIMRSQSSGHSGIIVVYLKGGLEESKKFVKSLKLFSITDVAGGCESTIQIPHIMSHKYLSGTQKMLLNITESMVKMSIGLENICDIILDIEQALDGLKRR